MRKILFYSIFTAILISLTPVAANAASYDRHHRGHYHYVNWHGHRGYWEGARFVIVEPPPVPVIVPAYYPQPYPQPVYYVPAPVPAY